MHASISDRTYFQSFLTVIGWQRTLNPAWLWFANLFGLGFWYLPSSLKRPHGCFGEVSNLLWRFLDYWNSLKQLSLHSPILSFQISTFIYTVQRLVDMGSAVSVAFSSPFLWQGVYEPWPQLDCQCFWGCFLTHVVSWRSPACLHTLSSLFFKLFQLETICCYYSHTKPRACWPSVI